MVEQNQLCRENERIGDAVTGHWLEHRSVIKHVSISVQVHHDRAVIGRCLRIPNDVGGVYVTLLEPALDVDGKIVFPQASTVCRSSFKRANGGDCRAGTTRSVALSCR